MQLHISARIFGTINCSTHQLSEQGDCSRDTIWIICRNLKFRFVIKRKIWLVLLFMNVFRVKFHQEVPRVRAMCRGALRWSHLDSQRWIPFQYRSLWRTLHVWKTVSTLIFPFICFARSAPFRVQWVRNAQFCMSKIQRHTTSIRTKHINVTFGCITYLFPHLSVLTSSWREDVPRKGVWIERMLIISELQEENFNINYTCQAMSPRGFPRQYFTLLPAGKDTEITWLTLKNIM